MSHTVAGRERGGKSTRLFVDPGKGTSRKEAPAMQREVGGAGAAGPDEGREPGDEDSEDGKKHPDLDTLGIQPQITAPFYCPPRCMKSSPLPEGLALTTRSPATFWSLHTYRFLPVPYVSRWTTLLSQHPFCPMAFTVPPNQEPQLQPGTHPSPCLLIPTHLLRSRKPSQSPSVPRVILPPISTAIAGSTTSSKPPRSLLVFLYLSYPPLLDSKLLKV